MNIEHKIFGAEVKEFDEKDLTVTHFISTEKRDRGGDILYSDGMRIEGKPVVLFQHGFGESGMEPIAKAIWIKKGEFKNRKGIQAKTQFYPDDLGRRLWDKTTHGYMPNWSIGWRPLPGKSEMKTERDGSQIRHVYEWDLFEYSIVGVPMQSDAQTTGKDAVGSIQFKVLPEIEEKRGDLVAWKDEEGAWEEKPYPNEHACRLESPDKYVRIRRENDKFGAGIHALWGIQEGGKPVELQAIRFSLEKFTVAEARAWVKTHDYKCTAFEPATGGKGGGEEGESLSCGEDESKETLPLTEENPPAQDAIKDESPSGDADVVKDILVCLAELKAELSALKEMVKPEPIPDDLKDQSATPPELVIERDDLTESNAKDAIIGAIREVVGERIQSDIDRMKGKVK